MRMLKILFWCIWRLWFYVLVLIPILIMSPFLTLSLSKDSWYPYFFKMARLWAKIVLYGMGFHYKIKSEQPVLPNHSYMFIANHTSMTDIMLMLAVVKNPFVFVGKKELVKIPIFGFFYKRAAIMVDRDSMRSRSEVYERAKARINQGLSICIFPEGKVPDDESVILDEFKSGAFNIAIDHELTIVPIVFYDNKNLFSYTFFSGKPGCLRVQFLSFVKTTGMTHEDKKIIKDKSRKLILNKLLNDPAYMRHSNKNTHQK
ncbi:1-acyl-sn-glycerol-3-phosphate acyltransferase [Flavobacterium columnare]|uniref:lysophospholipid acyltransferase family protein n=1 Tax=Flavobacterium TaxID=237 RepID=UPI000B5BEFF9|nr:lysophospholipid acyltransferase family protein [Flavobacterium columnare]OXA81811.1 1-acyl-sn-glycerol-3-phosphate acyltransferase [Flavobacterium columnare NBRC 100251 = ATCC 23463]